MSSTLTELKPKWVRFAQPRAGDDDNHPRNREGFAHPVILMTTSPYLISVRNSIPPAYRGDQDFVDETVLTAKQAIEEFYHAAVVAYGGDTDRAAAMQEQHGGTIRDLAINLSIVRRGDSVDAAGQALRDMMGNLEALGYQGGRAGIQTWLAGVLPSDARNDAVLRSAGFDVTRMRSETKTAQDDVQALIALLKEQLELLRTQVQLLQDDRDQGVDPTTEAAALALTGADALLSTERTPEAPLGVVATGTLRVTDLDPTLTARLR